jgi:hypothetical protein
MDKTDTQFTKIVQVGFVVRDLEATVKRMRLIFGIEPEYGIMSGVGVKYRGNPSAGSAKIAFFRFANMELEIIKPTGGKSIWQDFLDSGREGFHHIKFDVDNMNGAIAEMSDKGCGIYSEGLSIITPGMRWVYYDTENLLPFIMEASNFSEVNKNQSA